MPDEPNPCSVIVYELNEVPWEIVDRHASRRPHSNLAQLLARARCETTVNPEEGLQPWRTWPTFHTGLPATSHKSLHLGQDPATFEGDPIWELAERAGLSVGLFGPLQSWPAHEPQAGGFYIPDTFSRDADVYPQSMRRFQEFNLFMTREQGFSSNAPLDKRRLALAAADIAVRGFSPWSAAMTARQLLRERRDQRYKACRSIFQALPAFDLYWRLHRRTRPRLSVFFTNHVAGMMHRFWGDAMPEYSSQNDYVPDEVFATFIDDAMDVFDHQLGRIMSYVDQRRDTVVMMASSMGQHPVPYTHIGDTYVVRDVKQLAGALELGAVEAGLAMYPRSAFACRSRAAAEAAVAALASVRTDQGALFNDINADGLSVSFAVRVGGDGDLGSQAVHGTASDPQSQRMTALMQLGIHREARLGGGNTAYHSAEGPLITYGPGVPAERSRARVEVYEIAPRILETLGVSPPSRPAPD